MFLILTRHYLQVCDFDGKWINNTAVYDFDGKKIAGTARMNPTMINGMLLNGTWDIRPMTFLEKIGLKELTRDKEGGKHDKR